MRPLLAPRVAAAHAAAVAYQLALLVLALLVEGATLLQLQLRWAMGPEGEAAVPLQHWAAFQVEATVQEQQLPVLNRYQRFCGRGVAEAQH